MQSAPRRPTARLSPGEEELLGARVARAAKRPVVAERRRDVAESRVGHHDALHHRRQADRADLPEVVDPDPEQLLRELGLLLRRDGLGLIDDLHDALDRSGRLDPGKALDRTERSYYFDAVATVSRSSARARAASKGAETRETILAHALGLATRIGFE